uniref:Uncharacterized protein n=1 Tax=Bionectria ochroleuca TaxID=29856 RepID=A0A8H7TU18_BIOOC
MSFCMPRLACQLDELGRVDSSQLREAAELSQFFWSGADVAKSVDGLLDGTLISACTKRTCTIVYLSTRTIEFSAMDMVFVRVPTLLGQLAALRSCSTRPAHERIHV